MSVAHTDLVARREALESIGFTTVEIADDHFVAVRMKMHWAWGVRMVALVRVRRVGHLDKANAVNGHKELERAIHSWNPSKVPRGFGVFWALMDVVLADTADDDALAWVKSKVGKGFAYNTQSAVVLPEGAQPWPSPVWGAAYQPEIAYLFDVATSGQQQSTRSAPLAVVIGLISLWPGWIAIMLMCCGLPAIPLAVLVMTEKPPTPAIEG